MLTAAPLVGMLTDAPAPTHDTQHPYSMTLGCINKSYLALNVTCMVHLLLGTS
jgi:hypothetical protein